MNQGLRKAVGVFVMILLLFNLTGCGKSGKANAVVDKKLELAVKYIAENNFKEAVLAYNEVIKIDRKNIEAYKGLSLALALQKKINEAENALKDGLKVLPDNEQLQLAMAGFMLDQGKYDSAEAIYKELTGKAGASVQAFQAYSDCMARRGKTAEAIAFLEKAAPDAGEYEIKALLAELYMENGQREEALAAINQSLIMEPNQSAAYQLLVELYQNKWADMLALGDRYIQQDQTLTGVLYRLTALCGMGRYDHMIVEYEKLSADIKANPRIRLLAAEAYGRSDQLERAAGCIQNIKLTDIKDAGMLAEVADYYLRSGDQDSASRVALRGIDMDPGVMGNYVVIYNIYEEEDPVMARTWGLKCLLAGPSSYTAAFNRLTDIGLKFGIQIGSDEVRESREIVKAILIDRARAVKHFSEHPDWPHENTYVYLDTKHNIAYKGYCTKSEPFNPVVEKYLSPNITTRQQIQALLSHMNMAGDNDEETNEKYSLYLVPADGNWAWPVIYQGDLTFEDHLRRAGYSVERVTFVDK